MKTSEEQRAFLDAAMQEISLASGISPETLRALPVKSQADILFLHAALPDDAVMLHRRMREHLAAAVLPDIATLMKTPLPVLKALPAEQQKAICGAFDMLYGTVSDEELAAELTGALQRMEGS